MWPNATKRFLLRSVDEGVTWDTLRIDTTGRREVRVFTVAPDGTMFAGAAGGIWRSTDGGIDWTETPIPIVSNDSVYSLVGNGSGKSGRSYFPTSASIAQRSWGPPGTGSTGSVLRQTHISRISPARERGQCV